MRFFTIVPYADERICDECGSEGAYELAGKTIQAALCKDCIKGIVEELAPVCGFQIMASLKEMREHSIRKREQNRINSTEILREHRIEYETRNDGVHLIIKKEKGIVNFWPGTGKFMGALNGRGIFNLLKQLERMTK